MVLMIEEELERTVLIFFTALVHKSMFMSCTPQLRNSSQSQTVCQQAGYRHQQHPAHNLALKVIKILSELPGLNSFYNIHLSIFSHTVHVKS